MLKFLLFLFILPLIMAIPLLIKGAFYNYYNGPISDHFDGKRFYNPNKPREVTFFDMIRWRYEGRIKGGDINWPDSVENKFDDVPPSIVEGNDLRITFIGQASFLIQTNRLNIITDPIWSERASPISFGGPKRVSPPGIKFDNLPKIDILLISHNHYDHLDLRTIKRLWDRDKPRIITPLGNDTIIKDAYPEINVEVYDWDQTIEVKDQYKITLDYMHHWSARSVFDRNKALWAAFIIETGGGKIYFVGDSGYGNGDYFREAKEKYGKFRLAILPIGAYKPKWFMSYSHMDPVEAIKAYKDLGEPFAIASHFATFKLTSEGIDEPENELANHMKLENISENQFKALKIGQSIFVH